MSAVRRLTAAASLAFVASCATVPFATAGIAAPPAPKCPNNGNQYPPGQCKKAEVSSTAVTPGGHETIQGSGFNPHETVDVTLHSTPVHLATVTANSSGVATATVTIPKSTTPGTHTLMMTGRTSHVTNAATITVAGSPVVSHSGSGLPFTGAAEAIPLAASGAAMVIAGGLTLFGVRRRRRPVAAV